jgi:LysR family transcriptional regulator (chromosome initiation inhibitor)
LLDYPSLVALAAVVREGSFDRAARALHVTPSAVSQRIRLLEERLGCALVVRGQPCEATETGRRLCLHIDRVGLLEHELRADLPSLMQGPPTRVSIPLAVNADSLATWFMAAANAFAHDHSPLLQIAVDDESHTAHWLRSGQVLAAVTATVEAAAGCNSVLLGAMRYVAAASPQFLAKYFPDGIDEQSLTRAPSLSYGTKDELQQRWVAQHLGIRAQIPRHTLPSPQAFVAAALGGMGWAMQPLALVRDDLARRDLVELLPGCSMDIPLYWQHARMASSLIRDLTQVVVTAARDGLVQYD